LRQLRVQRQLAEARQLLHDIEPLDQVSWLAWFEWVIFMNTKLSCDAGPLCSDSQAAHAVLEETDLLASRAAEADDHLRGTEARLSRLLIHTAKSQERLRSAARRRHWSSLLSASFVLGKVEREAAREGPGRPQVQDADLAALVIAATTS